MESGCVNRAPEPETYSVSGIIKVAEGTVLKTEKWNKNPTQNPQNKETQGNDAVRHMVGSLVVFCAEPGFGLDDPCGSSPSNSGDSLTHKRVRNKKDIAHKGR